MCFFILHNQNCNLLKTINQNILNDNIDNIAREYFRNDANKLTKDLYMSEKMCNFATNYNLGMLWQRF